MTSRNGLICFTNCLLPMEDGSLVEKDLWIDERRGVVVDSQKTFFLRKQRPDRVINMEGNIVSPGYIDIQINGAYGFDFSVYEGDPDAYRRGLNTVAEKIVETGVTSLVPTIITQEKSLYPTLLSLLRPYAHPTGATLLGWHAEGPFLQEAKRGAHAPLYIRSAPNGFASFEDILLTPLRGLEMDSVASTTLQNRKSSAPWRRVVLSHPPFIANAMSAQLQSTTATRQSRGLLEVADLEFERPFYELIVDGIHSHPNSVKLAYNVYPEGCILITDAMKILDPHLKDGVHEWRDGKRFVKEGIRLYLEGTDRSRGVSVQTNDRRSVVTLDTCVSSQLFAFTGCSLGEAIKCATFNPLGTLRPGADADLVVLDRMEVWNGD
ncbi:carbohydrate esterase family 9 protein [Lactarius hengduanensis]|nr:carbohydrate esterase family 9 protein [Lactarius hengduanensis]